MLPLKYEIAISEEEKKNKLRKAYENNKYLKVSRLLIKASGDINIIDNIKQITNNVASDLPGGNQPKQFEADQVIGKTTEEEEDLLEFT